VIQLGLWGYMQHFENQRIAVCCFIAWYLFGIINLSRVILKYTKEVVFYIQGGTIMIIDKKYNMIVK
jgi:hypothetical protein